MSARGESRLVARVAALGMALTLAPRAVAQPAASPPADASQGAAQRAETQPAIEAAAERPPTPPPYEQPPQTLAWASLLSAGVCLATGIGFGVAAVVEDRYAGDIGERAVADEELSGSDRTSAEDALATRDDYRVVSGIAAGTGLGLFLIAGVLFARADAERAEHTAPPLVGGVAARPWLGPGLAGGAATVSF